MAEELRDLSSRQQELAEICLKLVSTLSFSEVCRLVVQAGVDLVQADRARIFLWQEDGDLWEETVAGSSALPVQERDEARRRFRPGQGLAGWIAREGLPLLVDDVRRDPRWAESDWAERNDIRAFAGVPVRWGSETAGVFTCLRKGRHPFTGADVEVLSILAGYTAAAVQNARLHEEASRSRDFFWSVVEDNADPIVVTDAGGQIIHWNPSAERMYGYSREEALYKHVDLISPTPHGTQPFRDEVLRHGGFLRFETWRRRKDGVSIPVSLTLSPVKQADGKVVALVGIHRDLSEHQRGEEERTAHVVQLERLQQLSQKIGASLALEDVLRFIVESVVEILKVPCAVLNLREGDRFVRRAEVNPFGPRGHETRAAGQGAAGWVAERNEILYIEDVQESPLYRNKEWAKKAELGSYLAAPLRAGGQVIGILNCLAKGVRRFSENEVFLLANLANSASVAIQNAERHRQLEEALERQKRVEAERAAHIVQLRRLQDLSQKIGASLSLAEVLQFVVESVSELLDIPVVSLNLRGGDKYVRRAEVNPFGPRENETFRVGEGATGRAAQMQEPLYIENVEESPLFSNKRWAKRAGLGSYFGVPLRGGEAVIGVLACHTKGVRRFSENEVFLLTTLANSAAIAIQNAERHRQLEEALEQEKRSEAERADHIVQLRRLQELSRKIGASLALDEVLRFLVESVSELLDIPVVSLNLRDGEKYVRRAEVNPFGTREHETRSVRQGASGWIAERKEPLYIEDVLESPLFLNKRWAKRAGLRSYLGVPVMRGEEVIGVLACHTKGVRKFTENEVFLLTTLVGSASVAIQNAESHRQLEEALEQEKRSEAERADHIVQLRRLQELSQKVGASLALDEVLRFVVESASEVLKVPAVALNLREGKRYVRQAEVNPFGPREYGTRGIAQGATGWIAEKKEPLYIEDVQESPLFLNKQWAKRAGLRSCLGAPVMHGDEVIGVIVCNARGIRKFGENEVFLLTTLANSAAVAIQNAERHRRLEEALEQERRSERERTAHIAQLGRLRELSQKISASLDLDEVLQFLIQSAGEILQAPYVALNLREGERFVRRAAVNPFPGPRGFETRVAGQGAAGWVAEKKQVLYIEDVRESSMYQNREWAKRAGLGSFLGVPLMGGGQVIGILNCLTQGVRRFTENEVFLLTTLADSASIAIQNAGHHRQLEEALEQVRRSEAERAAHITQLGRLQELSQKIGASLALDEVLQFVVESASEIFKVPCTGLSLREGDEFVRRAEVNPFGPRERFVSSGLSGGTTRGRVAEAEGHLYIEDVRKDPLYKNREWAANAGLGSYLGVSLRSGGQMIGVLSCMAQEVRKFTENEVFLLTTLANSASIAIQNAERHRQLEEALEQVKRSQEIARRAERLSALAMLSEGAAHELLNPANIIGLHAQRMQWENEEGSPGSKTAEVILRNVKRITRICDALRQFSQDRPPGQELLEANALVKEVVEPLEPEMRLHSIQDEMELGRAPRRVMGDPAELRQALFHLVRNAMEAMPRGGKLKVATRELEEEGRLWWEARVSDTGEGILPENLSRIFDPFYTTKPPDKATGLGLSVTHGIVERHGGKLWAESAPGQGAAFVLRLPAAQEA